MKTKIRLDTITDIANFVLIASQIKPDVYLTNNHGLKVNGKSFLGVAHAHIKERKWGVMGENTLFVSRDFVKKRQHIHYLMKYSTHNSAHAIATFNSKKNTITLKEEAFELCSVAKDFVKLSLEDEKLNDKRKTDWRDSEHFVAHSKQLLFE